MWIENICPISLATIFSRSRRPGTYACTYSNKYSNISCCQFVFRRISKSGLFFALLSEWNTQRKFPGHVTESVAYVNTFIISFKTCLKLWFFFLKIVDEFLRNVFVIAKEMQGSLDNSTGATQEQSGFDKKYQMNLESYFLRYGILTTS